MDAALPHVPTKPVDAVRWQHNNGVVSFVACGGRATSGRTAGRDMTASSDETVRLAALIAYFYSSPRTHIASGTSSNRLRV